MLLPDISREALDDRFREDARRGRRSIVSLVPEVVPRRLAECLITAAAIPLDRMGPELSRDERRRLVTAIKDLALPIAGTLGFEKAEVTSGGVALERDRTENAGKPAGSGTFLRRRNSRSRRLNRRLQLPGRVEHGLAWPGNQQQRAAAESLSRWPRIAQSNN